MIAYLAGLDQILAHATAVYSAACVSVLGAVPDAPGLRYGGVERPGVPAAGSYWGRASVETVLQDSAIVGQLDNTGKQRCRNQGYLLIEVFAPKAESVGYDKIRQIASQMRSATKNAVTAGGVVFQHVRVDDSPKTNDQWLTVCLWADWQFDEIL